MAAANDTSTADSLFMSRLFFVVQTVSPLCMIVYIHTVGAVVWNLIKGRLTNPFYACIVSLALPDLFELCVLASGEQFINFAFKNESLWRVSSAFIIGVQVASAGNMLTLAILRYYCIVRLYSAELCWIVTRRCLAVAWLVTLVWAILGATGQVFGKTYDAESGDYNGIDLLPLAFATSLAIVATVVVALGLYLACILAISRNNKLLADSSTDVRKSLKVEYRILVQSVFLCSAQICAALSYGGIVKLIFESDELHVLSAYLFGLINYGSNPFVYLIFSSELRHLAYGCFCVDKNQVVPI